MANETWCADFKGWFRTGDGVRCDPLTITDYASRYLIACRGLKRPTYDEVRSIFEISFREFGLPNAIRTDNGPPFSTVALGGLSRLSVWWIKLGILPERIRPGHPEENGRHERMHRTLKDTTASPPKARSGPSRRPSTGSSRITTRYDHTNHWARSRQRVATAHQTATIRHA